MRNFVLHDSFGEIVVFGRCEDSDFEHQHRAGLTMVEGEGGPDTHYVNAEGKVAQYTASEASAKRAARVAMIPWSNQTMSAVDVRSLESRKAAKWAEIKAERDARIDAPLTAPHLGVFDCDAAARRSLYDAAFFSRALADLGMASEIDFTLADNTTRLLDAESLLTVSLAVGAKIQAARATATRLRALIESAPDGKALDAVEWPQ